MRRRSAASPPPDRRYASLFWAFAILGVGLRLALFWVNPPPNSFDDHYSPILWIMKYGSIPPKNALWQSYQPPVFYVVSALVGNLERALRVPGTMLLKPLQFVSCLAGLLTLVATFRILQKVPLSRFSRLLAFGAASFLPAHIYQTAMHSNDTFANLGVTVCAWMMLVARERGFPYRFSGLLGLVLVVTLFTKYNAFVVLPMIVALLISVRPSGSGVPDKRLAAAWLFTLAIPLLVLGAYCYTNWKTYGQALPWNTALMDPALTQPKAVQGLSFISFKPWECIATPILAPSNLDSFWTLIHGRMWFDMEPKFLFFLDHHSAWWIDYFGWLRGERPFPAGFAWTPFTRFMGSALITLGLLPLGLLMVGFARSVLPESHPRSKEDIPRRPGLQIFPVLLVANAVGIVYLTVRSPVFSSMKPTYLLNCLPAWAVLIGLGVQTLERHRAARWTLGVGLGALFALVTVHVFHIVVTLGFQLGL